VFVSPKTKEYVVPTLFETDDARFSHLMGLAQKAEAEADAAGKASNYRKRSKLRRLAAAYRDMAFAAMPNASGPGALEPMQRERSARADKLRRMTVENGCTPAEADTALRMLRILEGVRA
jgi:hypothetical protein